MSLPDRRSGTGGSDIAAIAGLHHNAAMDVYCDKLGLTEPVMPTLAMRLGLLVEPALADLYSELTGTHLRIVPLQRHPRNTFVLGSPDRLVIELSKGLELKLAGARQSHRWGEPGEEG